MRRPSFVTISIIVIGVSLAVRVSHVRSVPDPDNQCSRGPQTEASQKIC
jgi:hypothetical protein